jgi:hypothetical protein
MSSLLAATSALHLGPLALGAIRSLVSSLLSVLHGLLRLILCIADALFELFTILGGRRPPDSGDELLDEAGLAIPAAPRIITSDPFRHVRWRAGA